MKHKFRNFQVYALVTGAASGMGRIYSLRLAENGYNVILVDINAKGLEETELLIKSEIAASQSIEEGTKKELKVLSILQDLSVTDAADQIYAQTKAAGCEVEVLVNNAGVMYCPGFADAL